MLLHVRCVSLTGMKMVYMESSSPHGGGLPKHSLWEFSSCCYSLELLVRHWNIYLHSVQVSLLELYAVIKRMCMWNVSQSLYTDTINTVWSSQMITTDRCVQQLQGPGGFFQVFWIFHHHLNTFTSPLCYRTWNNDAGLQSQKWASTKVPIPLPLYSLPNLHINKTNSNFKLFRSPSNYSMLFAETLLIYINVK